MHECSTNLSVKGFKELKTQLRKQKKRIVHDAEVLARELAKKGVQIAKVKIVDLDAVFTGELLASIKKEKVSADNNGAVFIVKADSEHAIYVEMGTGIIGRDNPYPGELPAIYMSGNTIHQTEDGRYGWFYQDKNGQWRFTEGMPSRPFMFETANELREIVEETAREVFEK